MPIDKLIETVLATHYPNPPASEGEMTSVEAKFGITLPSDLRLFYRKCNGAKLFKKTDAPYRILKVNELCSVGEAIVGNQIPDLASWYVICDVRDSNYVAADFARLNDPAIPIIDCFHETFTQPGYTKIIAHSFTEFLESSINSMGQLFWLTNGYSGFGDAR